MPNTVELAIQKVFNVKIHLPNAPKIEDILWHSLLISWTKYLTQMELSMVVLAMWYM
jgi:hypothetical protein